MDETIYIVETENDLFLGMIEFENGGIIIRNGFRGHPKHVKATEITMLMPAEYYPFAEYVRAG